MTSNLKTPEITELKPHITVFGVGGAGGNAVNNMITSGLQGVEFVVANTDAQALASAQAERVIQMGVAVTEGLGAGSQPEVGRAAAEEVIDEIRDHLSGAHMVFITAGMGGGTGTGAAPVIARCARELGILTVGVVTKPFHFEGQRRLRLAEAGITELQKSVDTLIVIPNQNLFRIANEKTTFADAFAMADQVLYSGVACITDLMVKEGLINLDFADVRTVMREMGKAMMGTGESSGEKRAVKAAEAAIANPLLDEVSMKGARGLLISITGGKDLTLYEVDEAASRIREEVDEDANIILGATFDDSLDGVIRVSVVATGIDHLIEGRIPSDMAGEAPPRRPLVVTPKSEAPQPAEPAVAAAPEPGEVSAVPRVTAPTPPPAQAPAQAPPPAPAARTPDPDGVSIRAFEPSPALYREPEPAPSKPQEPENPAFVPPAPERFESRPQRMPRPEDFPRVGRAQLAQNGAPPLADEGKGFGLLRRLAHVGLGRRGDEETNPDVEPSFDSGVVTPIHPREAGPTEPVRRPAPPASGQAGQRPRSQENPPRPAEDEDGQFEIPAFLRRQSN